MSPVFHDYWRAIAASLTLRGHSVTTHTYDDTPALVGRAWHQIRHELPRRVGVGDDRALVRRHTIGAAASVKDASPQAVVIIKGDTLGPQFWDSLSGLPRVLWLYDEVRRTRWTLHNLLRAGPVATYSPLDDARFRAAGLDSRYLPLAFDHRLQVAAAKTAHPEVTFIGARYPNREIVLAHLHRRGVPVRAFGRDWSGHPVDRLRTWRLTSPQIPAERDVSRRVAYQVMAGSTATLNLHGDQDGFTMRTFEAAGVGGLQVIDRADLGDLYEPGVELVTWSEIDELVEVCRRAEADRRWSDRLRAAGRGRTLADHTFDHRVATLEGAWATA